MSAEALMTNDGRRFVRVASEPYTRIDGSLTELVVWTAPCAVCGEPFTVRTPARSRYPERSKSFARKHCDAHKRGHL